MQDQIALSNHIGTINFADPVNTKRAHEELVSQVRSETIHIGNKYKVQIKPFYFGWDNGT